jgi:hypothetical protein
MRRQEKNIATIKSNGDSDKEEPVKGAIDMNEFLLLAVVVVYLAIKPTPQRADEITASRPESSEISRPSSYVP